MTEDFDILQHLRAIRAGKDKTHQMLFDLTQRVASLEQKAAFAAVDLANINGRLGLIGLGVRKISNLAM